MPDKAAAIRFASQTHLISCGFNVKLCTRSGICPGGAGAGHISRLRCAGYQGAQVKAQNPHAETSFNVESSKHGRNIAWTWPPITSSHGSNGRVCIKFGWQIDESSQSPTPGLFSLTKYTWPFCLKADIAIAKMWM